MTGDPNQGPLSRRRVHNETTGGRGTKGDALYRIRRLLLKAHERVTERGEAKLRGLLAGDPHGEVRDAWHAKETLPMTYRIGDHQLAIEALDELSRDLRDDTYSPELNRLGRTLHAWRTQITNWHRSRVTNGPTEAANNLAKLIKRVSFGITNFDHYRTRVLLYAGKPDWTLLDTLTPRRLHNVSLLMSPGLPARGLRSGPSLGDDSTIFWPCACCQTCRVERGTGRRTPVLKGA